VCFLLSPLARAITAEILHVDGGYHAMGAPPASAIAAASLQATNSPSPVS
jgi:enoyl-[acyl-carrier-protein] reductase (NADH)